MKPTKSHNPLDRPPTKKWFLLRHGQSEANVRGIVASQLANAKDAYGLTMKGRAEVGKSVGDAASDLCRHPPVVIFASPFLRTRQTAAIAGTILDVTPKMDARLRERDFGDFELLADRHYQEVWDADRVNPGFLPGRAETVYAVAERVGQLIVEGEKDPAFTTGLLVTHCDVAMILSCVFQNIDPRHHRSLKAMRTGEVRSLVCPP